MIEIKISNFRGIQDKELCINVESVNLLSGPSGSGKSTIMNSIFWCLYGSLRTVKPLTGSSSTKRTSVEMTFEMNGEILIIKRLKNPEELVYINEDKQITLNDDEAQEKIIEIFGDKNVWLATSYLSQGERNHFLSMSASERMDFLQHLSLVDDPSEVIKKIDDKLISSQKSFTQHNSSFTGILNNFQKRFQDANVKKLDILKSDTLNDKLSVLEGKQVIALEKQLIEQEKNNTYYNTLLETIDKHKRLIDNIENNEFTVEGYGELDEVTIKEILDDVNVKIPLRKKLDELDKILNKSENSKLLENELIPAEPLNHDLIAQIKQRDKDKEKLKSVQSIIKNNDLKGGLEKRLMVLEAQPILALEQEKNELIGVLEEMYQKVGEMEGSQDLPFLTKDEVIRKESELDTMKNILSCPHCKKGIRVIGKVVQADTTPLNKEEIEHQRRIIDMSKSYNVLKEKIERKEIELNKLEERYPKEIDEKIFEMPMISNEDKKKIEKEIMLIKDAMNIPSYEDIEGLTIQMLEQRAKKVEVLKMNDEYHRISNELSDKRMLKDLQDEVKKLEKYLQEIRNKATKLKLYKKEVAEGEKKISSLSLSDCDTIKNLITQKKEEMEEARKMIEKSKVAEKLFKEKSQLMDERESLVDESKEVGNLARLKDLAIEVEHLTITSILETLNNDINEYLSMLFDFPIQIELASLKTLKSNQSTKPMVNYKIYYKGFETDSITNLSGGEADRVSLAITLALSKFSSSPFILLDEFSSGLDIATKDQAVKALRCVLSKKSILCISHDTVEGIYDYIIKV